MSASDDPRRPDIAIPFKIPTPTEKETAQAEVEGFSQFLVTMLSMGGLMLR